MAAQVNGTVYASSGILRLYTRYLVLVLLLGIDAKPNACPIRRWQMAAMNVKNSVIAATALVDVVCSRRQSALTSKQYCPSKMKHEQLCMQSGATLTARHNLMHRAWPTASHISRISMAVETRQITTHFTHF